MAAQIAFGAQAVPVLTRANVPGGSSLTELRITSPLLFLRAEALGARVQVHAMLNAEGWTMRGGQLGLGVWGEGFDDRRHPHTLAHELMVSATDLAPLPLGLHWSLSAGKGFAPFGTDDPMNRPAQLYPVNHHWSQILERAVFILGLRRGPVTLEGALFNGDEPERFSQWPNWSRFGDSWSVRALVAPSPGLELQGSYAHVKSPEHRAGAGPEHDKVSLSARLERPLAGGAFYGLAEWSWNSEIGGFFTYYSGLAEAQWTRGPHRTWARFERSDRPEEQRNFGDPFRSTRPHFENSNIGITRWSVATAGYGFALTPAAFPARTEAILEVSHASVRALTGIFDPAAFYGRNDLWMTGVGLRVAMGAPAHRMGRYGVATEGHHHHGE